MSTVNYNLGNSSLLGGMAPPALPGGAFGAAALPPGMVGAGVYIIVNTHTNNRYIGTSTNLPQRFQTRMETVTELGFSVQQMNQFAVFWGTISTQNTPVPMAAPPPVLPLGAYGAPLTAVIDGALVNLERLLIRYVLTQLGAGGTVSNNALAFGPYVNPTGNAVTVNFNWGANPLFAAGAHAAVWPAGGVGW